MSKTVKVCVAAALFAAMSMANAADKYSEKETHVVRGVAERMNTLGRFSKLAIEKSSSEVVKTFAKRDIEEHEKLSAELTALAKSLGIAGVGGGGGMSPGGAPGAAPVGAAPQGAAGGAPAGGPQQQGAGGPGGQAGGGGGPSSYANRYYTELQGLSGEAFDEMYMLRALQYHEDLERSLNEEIRSGYSKELMEWAKANIETYEAHAQLIQRILYGEQKSVPATGPLNSGMPAAGGAPAGATSAKK